MGFFDDLFKSESMKDGLKDGERGRGYPVRSFFDSDYKKGVDTGKGIRDGEKTHKEFDKHPISAPIVDAFLGGFDTAGKSKDYERTYNKVKYGESPRKVFGEELNSHKNQIDEEEDETDYYDYDDNDDYGGGGCSFDYEDRHYTTRDSSTTSTFNKQGLERLPEMPKLVKWLIGLGIAGGVIAIGSRGYINDSQGKKPQSETSISKVVRNRRNLAIPKNLVILYPRDAPYNKEWLVNKTTLFRSSDNGETWNILLSVRNIPNLSINLIDKVVVKDNRKDITIYLRGGVNKAIETRDKGRTWEYVIYHGRHYGSRSVKYTTQNNGDTWTK